MIRGTAWALTVVACALCSGCADDAPVQLVRGDYVVRLEQDGLVIRHGARELFRLRAIGRRAFTPEVKMAFGFFRLRELDAGEDDSLTMAPGDDQIDLVDGGNEAGAIRIELTEAGGLSVAVELDDARYQAQGAIGLEFACGERDRFWGFGEQYNFVDLRGRDVPIWVQEQGVGREEHPALPYVGRLTDSYFPMPYFVDPQAGRGFLLDNTDYAHFDLCAAKADAWRVEIWNGRRAAFTVLPGPSGMQVVEQLTAEVGRPLAAPPSWALSDVWLAAQGGRDAVLARLDTARSAGIPVGALWVQDWVGQRELLPGNFGVKYRWSVDDQLYPQLGAMIADLAKDGVRFLGYFNPFVLPDFEHFAEGADKGYLIRDPDDAPYEFLVVTFRGSLLDVTNPGAVDWFRGFADSATALGMRGWMADFGEWLPFDAQLHAGQAPSFHNRYPTAWHRINREALEAAYPDGDFVLLTRSGYTQEQRVAQVVWAGDQEANFEETDGFPTVVAAGLTMGLSGVPFFTHDIAGFSGGPRGRELFLRWTELGAFTPIMRTHDGLKKLENHHFDSDAETTAHFKKMALIHKALAPYIERLAKEAVERGRPLLRHTALVDPEWEPAYAAHRQWMLGEDVLVAPVLQAGATTVEVSFPSGSWQHLLTGETFEGRAVRDVQAPIGTPAAFVRSGKLSDIAAEIAKLR